MANSFEEIFGDKYDSGNGKGVWTILKETISKDLSQSVVSLASYNGDLIHNLSIFVTCPCLFGHD